jgi:riboflavin kinase/FMN adenylyltransferase
VIPPNEQAEPFLRLDDLPADLPPLAVAVGVFDGVHKGHQALLAVAQKAAEVHNATPAALTFHPHPASVFSPSRVPPLLTTIGERAGLLRAHGAQIVVVARFDRAFAAQTPGEFVRHVLLEKMRARTVIVGDDFRYGCDRQGDVRTLRAEGEQHGFAVEIVPPVLVDGVPARSSVIRQAVAGGGAGAIEEAARLLGRAYALAGTVVQGRQLGRTIGFPTANLAPNDAARLVPGEGVYAGSVHVQGAWHRAAISVGTNPTVVSAGARTIEAFLLDGFTADIYGETVTVEFVAFLRAQQKYDNLDTLIAQMNRDVDETCRRVPLA